MPTPGIIAAIARERTDQLFFEYVLGQLVPRLRRDNYGILAEKLEMISQPRTVSGLGRNISRILRYGFTYGSELQDRRKYFLREIGSLPPEERAIVNKYVDDNLSELHYTPLRKIRVGSLVGKSEEFKEVVVLSAIKSSVQ